MTSARIPGGRRGSRPLRRGRQGRLQRGRHREFAARGWPIRRVAATSSGALTAQSSAPASPPDGCGWPRTSRRIQWLDHGAWGDITHLSWANWLHARGLSTLRSSSPWGPRRHPASRRECPWRRASPGQGHLVTSSLTALPAVDEPLPRYGLDKDFDENDFVDRARWSEIATCAAASRFVPGPVLSHPARRPSLHRRGLREQRAHLVPPRRSDGASRHRHHDGVARLRLAPGWARTDLVAKLADILINERIAHDLGAARRTNTLLRSVTSALDTTGATAGRGPGGPRRARMARPAPDPSLPGHSAARHGSLAFADRDLRQAYIDAGRVAAEKVLGEGSPLPELDPLVILRGAVDRETRRLSPLARRAALPARLQRMLRGWFDGLRGGGGADPSSPPTCSGPARRTPRAHAPFSTTRAAVACTRTARTFVGPRAFLCDGSTRERGSVELRDVLSAERSRRADRGPAHRRVLDPGAGGKAVYVAQHRRAESNDARPFGNA